MAPHWTRIICLLTCLSQVTAFSQVYQYSLADTCYARAGLLTVNCILHADEELQCMEPVLKGFLSCSYDIIVRQLGGMQDTSIGDGESTLVTAAPSAGGDGQNGIKVVEMSHSAAVYPVAAKANAADAVRHQRLQQQRQPNTGPLFWQKSLLDAAWNKALEETLAVLTDLIFGSTAPPQTPAPAPASPPASEPAPAPVPTAATAPGAVRTPDHTTSSLWSHITEEFVGDDHATEELGTGHLPANQPPTMYEDHMASAAPEETSTTTTTPKETSSADSAPKEVYLPTSTPEISSAASSPEEIGGTAGAPEALFSSRYPQTRHALGSVVRAELPAGVVTVGESQEEIAFKPKMADRMQPIAFKPTTVHEGGHFDQAVQPDTRCYLMVKRGACRCTRRTCYKFRKYMQLKCPGMCDEEVAASQPAVEVAAAPARSRSGLLSLLSLP